MTRRAITLAGAAILIGGAAVVLAQRQEDPPPRMVPGQPIETRPPEKPDDKPVFPNQTRAPYRPGVAVDVTVITSKLNKPWSLVFLPDGRMLVTEKPGAMRIVDAHGTISQPISDLPHVVAMGQVGLLDVALDPAFGTNPRIFFTFSEPVDNGQSFHIAVARA